MDMAKKGKKRGAAMNGETFRYMTIAAMIAVLFVLFSFVSKGFLSFNTVMNLFRQAASNALAAIAMTMIMLTGGIDLSVGSVVAFSGAAGALAMQAAGGSTLFAGIAGIAATVAAATGFGLINGYAAGYLKIAPFIVTLATMSLARGLTLTVTHSSRVIVDNSLYNFVSQTDLFGKIPVSLLLVAAAYIAAYLLLTRTAFGRRTYAIGGNPVASRASGIDVEKHTLCVYIAAGVFIALSTIVIVGRARSAQPMAGVGMEFNVITAVVIGGTSLMGGQGNLKGTLLGVVLTSVIFTGLSMLDLSPFVNYMVQGSLILLAVLGNRIVAAKAQKSALRHAAGQSGGAEPQTGKKARGLDEILAANEQDVLELRHIVKVFPGVRALDDVSLTIKRGTIHALCGENGAGKSTLMKILSGVYTKDEGEILINGVPAQIRSPADSERIGISVIYQELANIPELNVSQNVNLGKELSNSARVLLDIKRMEQKTRSLLDRFQLQVGVRQKIDQLTVGQQQMIEIAKAFGSNAWIVVMDEPTSAITEADKENLFKIIRELKENNIAVVYISHRMSEIFEIADEITILRDGRQVITGPVSEFDENKVVRHMVGRELNDIFTREKGAPGEEVLRVENLSRKGAFEPISFSVRAGEVLGFSGLMGAGRTEIMRCIFGLDRPDSGAIYLSGQKLEVRCPLDAIKAGIAMVSEDRRREGIIPHMTVRENTTLAALPWISRFGWIDTKKDLSIAQEYIDSLNVKTPSTEQLIMNLSGGNQQKVCLAKWLNRNPKVVILDEPTRGIDVGAKAEIHRLIDRLTKQGIAVIMISSELPEIIGACDRIVVLYEGRMMKEYLSDSRVTQEQIMKSAAGLSA
ncbi:ATP-binding cassette domain-containing protein [Anaerotruncus colihominis]|uniref:ATP-binding cassette domain-containing protein n=1 Tax=Anaerotruncus colihominis TaxID=169435 RepID=A0A845REW1_9FIRM|nr:ATP-binding cassette domain-containing protein [Anaerotruncus colihominis]NBI78550.1 ATP-binding cassette domain-containing protein [Anaerotruncus colihominis]